MGRLLGRIWVGFTTCLIAFIAYSSQIFIIWPWYGRVLSVELIKLLLPFKCVLHLFKKKACLNTGYQCSCRPAVLELLLDSHH